MMIRLRGILSLGQLWSSISNVRFTYLQKLRCTTSAPVRSGFASFRSSKCTPRLLDFASDWLNWKHCLQSFSVTGLFKPRRQRGSASTVAVSPCFPMFSIVLWPLEWAMNEHEKLNPSLHKEIWVFLSGGRLCRLWQMRIDLAIRWHFISKDFKSLCNACDFHRFSDVQQ